MKCAPQIELQPRRRRMRPGKDRRRPVRHPAQDSQYGSGDNADQNRSIDFPRHQNEHDRKPHARKLRLAVGKAAQADEGCRIRHHQLGIAQSNKGDEHSDAAGGGIFQALGNSVDDLFPHAHDRENEKKHAGKKDNPQGSAPGNVHAQANHVGEVRVQ